MAVPYPSGYGTAWGKQGISAKFFSRTGPRHLLLVELLTRAELAVLDIQDQIRKRRPLLHVGTKFDRLAGSQWTLDGVELRINRVPRCSQATS